MVLAAQPTLNGCPVDGEVFTLVTVIYWKYHILRIRYRPKETVDVIGPTQSKKSAQIVRAKRKSALESGRIEIE